MAKFQNTKLYVVLVFIGDW